MNTEDLAKKLMGVLLPESLRDENIGETDDLIGEILLRVQDADEPALRELVTADPSVKKEIAEALMIQEPGGYIRGKMMQKVMKGQSSEYFSSNMLKSKNPLYDKVLRYLLCKKYGPDKAASIVGIEPKIMKEWWNFKGKAVEWSKNEEYLNRIHPYDRPLGGKRSERKGDNPVTLRETIVFLRQLKEFQSMREPWNPNKAVIPPRKYNWFAGQVDEKWQQMWYTLNTLIQSSKASKSHPEPEEIVDLLVAEAGLCTDREENRKQFWEYITSDANVLDRDDSENSIESHFIYMSFLDFTGVKDFSNMPMTTKNNIPGPADFIAMYEIYRKHPNVKLIEKETGRIVQDQANVLIQVLEDPEKKDAALQAWLESKQINSASDDDPEYNAFATEILERVERGEVCPGGGICGCTVYGHFFPPETISPR